MYWLSSTAYPSSFVLTELRNLLVNGDFIDEINICL